MATSLESTIAKAISPRDVLSDGHLTSPRSYGVYRLPHGVTDTRCYRFGNHPVRMQELAREFGSCKLLHLFLSRADAELVARGYNGYVA